MYGDEADFSKEGDKFTALMFNFPLHKVKGTDQERDSHRERERERVCVCVSERGRKTRREALQSERERREREREPEIRATLDKELYLLRGELTTLCRPGRLS